jgi:hypothetical protein
MALQQTAQTATENLHPRQAEFLALDCEEAMFGGAVGGGKTEALLRWLAEPVGIPGYSGLFLRRTHTQMRGSPTTPIERSWRFFAPLGGSYNATEKFWRFANGSMVRFGHMQHEDSKHNYDGPEFHRIAFDQVEQFTETQYQYMFSRLRRTAGFPLPCGIRSAANPIGYNWVKVRFVSPEAIATLKQYTAYDPSPPGMMFEAPNGAVFVPSRVADNPSLEVAEYIERLRSKLGAVLAAQLANGDWSIVEGAQIDPALLRYYTMRGDILAPLKADKEPLGQGINQAECRRFATIDTAGTSRQKAQEDAGRPPSWSVVAVWDYWPQTKFLFLRHVWRERVDWKDLRVKVPEVLRQWGVALSLVENAHFGQPLAAEISGNVRLVNPVIPGMKTARVGDVKGAKLERAAASGLFDKLQQAQLYLPDVDTVPGVAKWMPECESELLGWTGRPDETADQVDVFSYAAHHTGRSGLSWGGVIPMG